MFLKTIKEINWGSNNITLKGNDKGKLVAVLSNHIRPGYARIEKKEDALNIFITTESVTITLDNLARVIAEFGYAEKAAELLQGFIQKE